MHLCTPKLIYYIKIKINIKTGTSQSAERLQALWDLFSTKFKVTVNELYQKKNRLRSYGDILLTGNCQNKSIKRVVKKQCKFQNEM